jgi:hypothetical protein
MFKHKLGQEAKALSLGLIGILVARSENLYGCNRYYLQPQANREGKVPDGWWIDEDDVAVLGLGVLGLPEYSEDKIDDAAESPPPGGPARRTH